MRRGERRLYRELGEAAAAVAASSSYAEEYLAKTRLVAADKALRQWAMEQINQIETQPRDADEAALIELVARES